MNTGMPSETARLLGFAPRKGAERLVAALGFIAGPPVAACHGPRVVTLLQAEPAAPLQTEGRAALTERLLTVQRRLEVACRAGLFLPMDPAAACCPAGALPALLAPAQDALADALAAHGGGQQWDIVLRWSAQAVLLRHQTELACSAPGGPGVLADAAAGVLLRERGRREAELLNALDQVVRAFAPRGASASETEIAVTVLVDAGAEAPVEAALNRLPESDEAAIDMRGPLPPLSFHAVRLKSVDAQAVRKAWAALDLPERADLAALHRQWRHCAAAVHPDRRGPGHLVSVSDLTAAYRLLKPLMTAEPGGQFQTLNALLRHAGLRLAVPEAPARVRAAELELAS